MSGEDKLWGFPDPDSTFALKDVIDAIEEKKQICIEKRLKFKQPEKPWQVIIIRDYLDKLIRWVNVFREIEGGDADPGSAALPWTVTTYLLRVRIFVSSF